MDFIQLSKSIVHTHEVLYANTVKAINVNHTIRNWLIGLYIVEFEQNGNDRARYGDRLLIELAQNINIKGLSDTNLKLCRTFYQVYPQISQTLSDELQSLELLGVKPIRLSLSDEFKAANIHTTIVTLNHEITPDTIPYLPPVKILTKLSFSHLVELFEIKDPLKRVFYEIESIKGNWSVRELRRQVNSLYFERSGLSKDKAKLSKIANEQAVELTPKDIIQSPFTFEFLGLKAKDVVYESELEKALIEHIQEFLLELGHGFCFEAQQKRITIGGEYFFIDLVFYHRILKCHVLIDLKVSEFSHENVGQLKTYINYFKKEIMQSGDNPPVGILLVTNKNDALVEFAMADSDVPLFVQKYQLELPGKEELREAIMSEIGKV